MQAFIHGMVLAFGLILPLGVQNLFVFTQGAEQPKFRRALPATITASISDTLLILLAVLGLSVIVGEVEWLRIVMMCGGAVFLIYMGYSMWRTKPRTGLGQDRRELSIKEQIVFALSVSLLNPHAILDTVGVIGTSALRYTAADKVWFTAACILVSWCWFLALTIAGRILKQLDGTGRMLVIINKCSAIFVWLTAVWLLLDIIGWNPN
ncbi:LysE/ArgO family amino acid transporter [Paenibacillus sp. D2_2]|uniref:LysE/ArgO family amino acid transporter n=1 Tax=Paenibacillus sp. D2_2 TaxID=3073092 RepID=UPI0028153164|nr:LysE/ArgO family amino acid transporter [Paenibacillus sp. D2_2]WMT39366.1 LysE/ArgO family amino acid transporter [Paenibacillus sp. D2_2]